MNTLVLLALVGAAYAADEASSALGGFPTSINGNVGVVGGGYGDVYGGKIKEGVYGMGGRVGGNLGLVGTAGLGRKRRQAAALNGASANAGAVASGPDAFGMAGAAAGSGAGALWQMPQGFPAVPAPAAPAAPAATVAPATAKPCPKRRRRSVDQTLPRNETVTNALLPSFMPFPVFPVFPVLVPTAGVRRPDGIHGGSAWGAFKLEGNATVDNEGNIRFNGTKFVDGDASLY